MNEHGCTTHQQTNNSLNIVLLKKNRHDQIGIIPRVILILLKMLIKFTTLRDYRREI